MAAMPGDHVAHNRAYWDADADSYQAKHGAALDAHARAWGVWRIPESELGVLGDIAGLDVLELGCGAAQWSLALATDGARATGLDVSRAQLRHAGRAASRRGVRLPLVQADGERLPFAARAFDVVFCDHGALSFCDPQRTVPEVARVLRAGGLLAFCAADPLVYLTWNRAEQQQGRKLRMSHDELGRIAFEEGTVDWVLSPGAWIRLLRAHGFDVEDLLELRAPLTASTTYDEFVPYEWACRWPAEQLWRARRR
jgi:SAM-dependent methyltransferase